MIRVEPLTPAERAAHRCAYCGKGLLPQRIASVSSVHSFRSNRRVIKARPVVNLDGEWWITYWPEDDRDWGYDGTFCTLRHAQKFALAAHRAGYRMKGGK
jgi:hypothetical protein